MPREQYTSIHVRLKPLQPYVIYPDECKDSVTHIDGFSGGYGHECCSETGQEMVQLGTR